MRRDDNYFQLGTERKSEPTLFFTLTILCGIMNMFNENCNISFMGIGNYPTSPFRLLPPSLPVACRNFDHDHVEKCPNKLLKSKLARQQ